MAHGSSAEAYYIRTGRHGGDVWHWNGSPGRRPGDDDPGETCHQIKLTKAAADHSDIVTPGDVVVLHKDGLMMCSSASSYAFSNTYSNGVLAANYKNRAKDAARSFGFGQIPVFGGGSSAADAANNGCASRKFVAGEKFWVTGTLLKMTASWSAPSAIPTTLGNESVTTGKSSFFSPRGRCRQRTIL